MPFRADLPYKEQMMISRTFRAFCLAALLLTQSSCASLAVPNLSAEPEALRDGAYRLDPAHATLLFKVNHLGLSTYVGRFNEFNAVLDFDAANPEAASLEAVIEVGSLDVNNRPFADTLTGPGWFDAENHPQARFVSNDIEITGDNTGIARGSLTLKGVTRPLDIEIIFNGGANNLLTNAYTIGFDAKTSFNRSDYGMRKFRGFVGDKVRLEFYGEFQRVGKPEEDTSARLDAGEASSGY